jgi:hypothetical protein
MMTREQLLQILRNPSGDTEADHARADDALLAYINDPEITEAYNAIERWYA